MVQFSAILPNFLGHTLSSGPVHLLFLELLGSGAYGTVYLARDLRSPESIPVHYAVKCLLRHPKDSDQDQFQKREIAYHKAVSHHPHVVNLHTVVEEEHFIYLVMDYCPGGDLFSAIIDRRSFSHNDSRVKAVFVELLDAVHSCHDQGVFHRDLKPENILCSKGDDHVFVSDFGLSTKTKLSSSIGCGSSFYMSPECIGIYTKKRPFSASRSDIWSLGVILTNLITGRSPWHIASPHDDPGFRAYLREGAPYLRRMLPISRGASEILASIFELNPAKRATINQLRAAVLALDTFFIDAPDHVRVADESHVNALEEPQEVDITDCRPSGRLFSGSAGTTLADASMFVNGSRVPSGGVGVGALSFPGIASPSSPSSSGSSGPATPETRACNPAVYVPDMNLEGVEEGRSDCDLGLVGMKAPVTSQKMLPRSWQRFVGAVQRIRVRA
ncbi:Pkinase-domain-containing protein [Amylocystis lapponica]|nr:Pkinase-domain-containing protein [Amylocystis lapponica]